jgi:exonuclease III
MKPRIISWNVKGLNNRDKCLRVSSLPRDWKADIVCLQETKLQGMSHNIVHSLWGLSSVDWCCLDSNGALDGILIM